MSFQYDISRQEPAISEEDEGQFWAEQLARYLRPYQERLDAYVDRRVVGNLMATVGAIVQSRCAWTPSELGSAICGPATPRPELNDCSTPCIIRAGRPK